MKLPATVIPLMNNLDLAILIGGIAYSFLIIGLVDHGMQLKLQLCFLFIPFLGLLLYILTEKKSDFYSLSLGFLTLPIFIVAWLNLLNILSWKINKREFRLKARGSRNLYKHNTNGSDTFFTFLLLISLLIWPFLIAFLFKNKSV